MNTTKDIKVASSKGEIVTYEEHCRRLDAYLEEVKEEAVKLTTANPSLTTYIHSLKLLHGDLFPSETGCRYFQVLESSISKPTIPEDDRTNVGVALDESGYPELYWAFVGLRDQVKSSLIYDFFLPRLVQDRPQLLAFIKRLITEDLRWTYEGDKQQEDCFEITCVRNETEFFWLVVPQVVRVLIGTHDEIKTTLDLHKEYYAANELLLVDINLTLPVKQEEDYHELLKDFAQKQERVWDIFSIGAVFSRGFRELANVIDAILHLGVNQSYQLGQMLSSSEDEQDQLIQSLRTLETGVNIPHENLVEQILTFCFSEEFTPFRLIDQVQTIDGERRRDFILDNRNPKAKFWEYLKIRKGVEKIVIDAKNYQDKLNYADIANTVEYLINPAFGNFMIIISRQGINDYRRLLDAYLRNEQVVLVLTDEDLVAMITAKREGNSPTEIIEERYYEFLNKK